ncbi:hypothetical protein WA158_006776 [Blastocystis sp. Blastoise]
MKCIFVDLSGTIYSGTTIIPGALEGIQLLHQSSQFQYCFVSNATSHTRNGLYDMLCSMGLTFINKEHIFSSGELVKSYLISKHHNPYYIVEDTLIQDLIQSDPSKPYSCVVIGTAESKLNYNYLNQGFKIILNGGELIGLNMSYYNVRDDGYNLAAGGFIDLIAKASDIKPTILGKPNPSFFKMVAQLMKYISTSIFTTLFIHRIDDFNDIYMIGDDIVTDIGGIQAVGGHGILVKTGKYREGCEMKQGIQPDYVANDLYDAVQYLLTTYSS